MTRRPRDPLLLAARLLVNLGMGLAALVGFATLCAAPAMVIFRSDVLGGLTDEAGHAVPAITIGALAVVLLLVAAMAACAFYFLRDLKRIIDSVGHGDPFVPVNAVRLARMGWLTIAIELLSIPVGGVGEWMAQTIKGATSDFGIDASGILLALILFILARVFREGARMREDLEGTV